MHLRALRCLIGITLLFTTSASAAEAVFGSLQDGVVHYESAFAQGPSGAEDSGPTHAHDTPADHCTHFHGAAAFIGAFRFSLATPVSPEYHAEPAIHAGWSAFEEFHPPRA